MKKIMNTLYLLGGWITALTTASIVFIRTIKKLDKTITEKECTEYQYLTKKQVKKETITNSEFFSKATIQVVCGSFVLDLSKAKIKPNTIIDCDVYMGSCNIIIPEGFNVKCIGTTVMAKNHVNLPRLLSPNTPNIFIRSNTQFGILNIQKA